MGSTFKFVLSEDVLMVLNIHILMDFLSSERFSLMSLSTDAGKASIYLNINVIKANSEIYFMLGFQNQ
jgi:hypothetical protein